MTHTKNSPKEAEGLDNDSFLSHFLSMDRTQVRCQDDPAWSEPEQLLFTEVKCGPKEQPSRSTIMQ